MDIRTQLEKVGEQRAGARAELQATSERIAELARIAHANGMAKTEIARLARISRPTLNEMLRDHDGS